MPSIQQTAALALGRLANYSEDLAEAVVGNEILPQLVYSLSDQNVSLLCVFILVAMIFFYQSSSIIPAILQEGCCLCPACSSEALA
ncbi:hypothetical protein EON65_14860 [archaeon]|nr:MAG: hypothetical protein EON65_14860 [archaeon]